VPRNAGNITLPSYPLLSYGNYFQRFTDSANFRYFCETPQKQGLKLGKPGVTPGHSKATPTWCADNIRHNRTDPPVASCGFSPPRGLHAVKLRGRAWHWHGPCNHRDQACRRLPMQLWNQPLVIWDQKIRIAILTLATFIALC
jgi:hypothetical protein